MGRTNGQQAQATQCFGAGQQYQSGLDEVPSDSMSRVKVAGGALPQVGSALMLHARQWVRQLSITLAAQATVKFYYLLK